MVATRYVPSVNRPIPSICRSAAIPVAVAIAAAATTAALVLAGCGERTPLPHVGKVTPAGRVFEREDFSITVPLRFMGASSSLGASRALAEQSGLRKVQVEAAVSMQEVASTSGVLRIGLFDGTSNDYERADQILVYAVPSGSFSKTDRVLEAQRVLVWLGAEPLNWERLVVKDREVDRLHSRLTKFGVESMCYFLDTSETTYAVEFLTKPERTEKFFAEAEEIMKSFTAK